MNGLMHRSNLFDHLIGAQQNRSGYDKTESSVKINSFNIVSNTAVRDGRRRITNRMMPVKKIPTLLPSVGKNAANAIIKPKIVRQKSIPPSSKKSIVRRIV